MDFTLSFSERGEKSLDDLFLEHYILSLFTDDTQVTVKQLSLIAGGKRTPSVLFNVEKNRLYALYFSFAGRLTSRVGETGSVACGQTVPKNPGRLICLSPLMD
ncbi:MAG: hypothetical protein U5K84_08410 [Alkalibacterium sp.]|nr:hypothetical protein [Alkalibacterium sp.]